MGIIKGPVHIVAKFPYISMTDDDSIWKKPCPNLPNESSGWETNQFYVNRFYVLQAVEIDENGNIYQR